MTNTFSTRDYTMMAEAIRLAKGNVYLTMPNPSVGCVVVKDNRIIGRGATRPAGEDHAEVVALRDAGVHAKDATVYVTLEPCCTQGRTGPCTEALIKAGVREVVFAIADPNPSVDGEGAAALVAAGIIVRHGLLASEAEHVAEGFMSRMRRGRPFVTLKTAASIDGATAMQDGESQWITSPAARADVQRLRAEHAAILTGIGTVIADNPSMTVRDPSFVARPAQPWRIVVDSRFRTPADATIVGDDGRCIVFGIEGSPAPAPLVDAGAQCEVVVAHHDRVSLSALLPRLTAYEINSLMVESGPTLAGAILEAGLVDRIVHYVAPKLLGSQTMRMFETRSWLRLADGMTLNIEDLRQVGDDMRLTLTPQNRQES